MTRNLVPPFIFCGLRSIGFNAFHNFSGISMIISSMLVMIDRVRELWHKYHFAVPTSEDSLKVSIVLILWEMWTGFVWTLIGRCGKLL